MLLSGHGLQTGFLKKIVPLATSLHLKKRP